jgi:hypothetical protein
MHRAHGHRADLFLSCCMKWPGRNPGLSMSCSGLRRGDASGNHVGLAPGGKKHHAANPNVVTDIDHYHPVIGIHLVVHRHGKHAVEPAPILATPQTKQ